MAVKRTKDSYQKLIDDFIKEIYVVCPSCNQQAVIKTPPVSNGDNNVEEIKLICTRCGHSKRLEEKPNAVLISSSNKTFKGRYVIIGGAIDPYFYQPLWLTGKCGDHVLWAYNYEHLDFLKEHVEAKLRERNTTENLNRSLGSRLPAWMTSRKNRESVLKAIRQLREKV